jgi:hypothetical protein
VKDFTAINNEVQRMDDPNEEAELHVTLYSLQEELLMSRVLQALTPYAKSRGEDVREYCR